MIKARKISHSLSVKATLSKDSRALDHQPERDLDEGRGIKPKVNLPGVGENFQGHLRIYGLPPNIAVLDILRYKQSRAAIELGLQQQGQTSLYQYSGSSYGFLNRQQTASNNTKLVQLVQASADPSNAVNRMKLSHSSDPTSLIPNVQLVLGDSYIGTGSYPTTTTFQYGKNYATLSQASCIPLHRAPCTSAVPPPRPTRPSIPDPSATHST